MGASLLHFSAITNSAHCAGHPEEDILTEHSLSSASLSFSSFIDTLVFVIPCCLLLSNQNFKLE